MDGVTATRVIRAREHVGGAHPPIVALTAHAMTGDRDCCPAAGMGGYLTSPLQAGNLHRLLAERAGGGIRPFAALVTIKKLPPGLP